MYIHILINILLIWLQNTNIDNIRFIEQFFFSDLVDYWNHFINKGTDLQRIKFHRQLEVMFKVST